MSPIFLLFLFGLLLWFAEKSRVARFILVALVAEVFLSIFTRVFFSEPLDDVSSTYLGIIVIILSLAFAWLWLDWRSVKKRDEKNNRR